MSSPEYSARVLAALESIARDTRELLTIARGGASGRQPAAAASSSGGGGDIASARDLDGPHGDPMIRKDPPRWSGTSYVGYKFSETEPDYLECVASFKDWAADNPRPGKERYARYERADAARARGWAERLSKGWQPPVRANGAASPEGAPRGDAYEGDDTGPQL